MKPTNSAISINAYLLIREKVNTNLNHNFAYNVEDLVRFAVGHKVNDSVNYIEIILSRGFGKELANNHRHNIWNK